MQLVEPRSDLIDYAVKKGEQGMAEYRAKKNAQSVDGLPVPNVEAGDNR
jgi:hypothetical protein